MLTIRIFPPLCFTAFLLACNKLTDEAIKPLTEKIFRQAQMQAGANYSRQKGGAAVLIMQNGQIIFENYHNGANENTTTHIQSGTKGFFAAVVALAIQERRKENCNQLLIICLYL